MADGTFTLKLGNARIGANLQEASETLAKIANEFNVVAEVYFNGNYIGANPGETWEHVAARAFYNKGHFNEEYWLPYAVECIEGKKDSWV
jgi:hypothetical protein